MDLHSEYRENIIEFMKDTYQLGYNFGISKKLLMANFGISYGTVEYFNLTNALYQLRRAGVIKVSKVNGRIQRGHYIYVPDNLREECQKINTKRKVKE